jgi:phosphoribosylanthranilate isomerase
VSEPGEKRILVKICGLKTPETLEAAIEAGADMIGLNFHPKSPRAVSIDLAGVLAGIARGRVRIVALAVDPADAMLAAILDRVRPDLWQLHGQESIERLDMIRRSFGLPVIKAIGWSETGETYGDVMACEHHADMLLLDAKPPRDAAYPGGHGRTFDWATLADLAPAPEQVSGGVEFMLSGGLTPENVGDAIRTVRGMGLNLAGVDVSSGVESAPGVKDLGKIRAFIAAVRETERRMAEGE